MPGIITQEGAPVEEELTDENTDGYEEYSPEEDIRAIAQDALKGFRRFKNSTILKVGIIAVAIKVVGVAGQIIIENQRLKAAAKERQERREQDEK